jgi:hypothetical protein
VINDPAANLKEEGDKLVLQYNAEGGSIPANAICRSEVTSKAVDNPCKKSNSPKAPPAPTKPRGLPAFPGHN